MLPVVLLQSYNTFTIHDDDAAALHLNAFIVILMELATLWEKSQLTHATRNFS